MSKPTTDDEVLALAEKIKQQRKINAEYSDAAEKLERLERAIDKNALKIRLGPSVTFETVAPDDYMDTFKVYLPSEMAGDLIQLIQMYIEEKEL